MKRINRSFLLLAAVFVISIIASAGMNLAGKDQWDYTPAQTESALLLENWEYSWRDGENHDEATALMSPSMYSNQSGDWQPLLLPCNPAGRNGSKILWLRTMIPQHLEPHSFLRVRGTQVFEIYLDQQLIFRHGRIGGRESPYIGTPPRLVPLPEQAAGKSMYIRFYSSSKDIGLMQKPAIASRSVLMMESVRGQAVRCVLGCFYILAGSIIWYPYIRLKQPFMLFFSCFAMAFGAYTVIRTSLVYLVWDAPQFWMMLELATLFLSLGFVSAFMEQLFAPDRRTHRRVLSSLHFWYGAVALALIQVRALEVMSVLRLYQALMLATILLLLIRVGRAVRSGQSDARIIFGGLLIFCLSGSLDISRQLMPWMNRIPEPAYIGGFFFLGSLIIVIIRRIHLMLSRLSNTEKLSMVGQMAAGVAHEIRNPITVISGYLQLMKREENHKPVVELMLGEVNRIELLINEFLFLAKPAEPRLEYRSIEAVTRDVLRFFENQAAESGIKVAFYCREELPFVYCDENQMKQVLVNVFKNAVEAMKEKGGELGIALDKKGDGLSVSISDTGVGIADEDMAKIGEPFFTTKENGNGLGIMICRRIVESHAGTFSIFSRQGEGTTVEILLPLDTKK